MLSNEFSAEFSINQQGWNSHHKLYSTNKNDKTRIAIIGDSYIAGLEPGYKNAIPYLLEQKLGTNKHEVFRWLTCLMKLLIVNDLLKLTKN